jgi:hypothetical protein
MTTREQAHEKTDHALALAALCGVVFAGEDPDCIGAALADVMATFLRNHKMIGDPRGEREMREAILEQWVKTVRDLVLIYDKPAGPTQ